MLLCKVCNLRGVPSLNGRSWSATQALMKPSFHVSMIFFLVALSGCQHGQRRSSTSLSAIIKVVYDPSQTCRVAVDGQSFALPADESALTAILKLQAARYRAARVDGDVATPYKCFGYAVFIAHRAGFKRVAFIAEPPSPGTKP